MLQVESGRRGWGGHDGQRAGEVLEARRRGLWGVPLQDLEKRGSSHTAGRLCPAPRVGDGQHSLAGGRQANSSGPLRQKQGGAAGRVRLEAPGQADKATQVAGHRSRNL